MLYFFGLMGVIRIYIRKSPSKIRYTLISILYYWDF